jgi:hypothetical protein
MNVAEYLDDLLKSAQDEKQHQIREYIYTLNSAINKLNGTKVR